MRAASPEVISEGPFSVVTRVKVKARWMAVKTSTTNRQLARQPHDIIREARLIAAASHPNVIQLIKHEVPRGSQSLSLSMPYVPYSLSDLLSTPSFSPHPMISFGTPDPAVPTPCERRFVALAKSILFQLLAAVDHLHRTARVAHRDIKPANVLLSDTGRVQLIDFGIAWRADEDAAARARDLWPEHAGSMYFEVSTGPYRAPELLFGPRTYDASAIDCWSLGAAISDFFAPLRLRSDDDEDADEDADADAPPQPLEPFIRPKSVRVGDPTARWLRDGLFEGHRGEIGLAWSIFKVRGSPNDVNWPSFVHLPDANKVSFVDVHAVDLAPLLPNLPPSTLKAPLDTRTHDPAEETVPTPLDLVHRFLVYEPSRRLRPQDALQHPWFTTELLLPDDYPVGPAQAAGIDGHRLLRRWESKSLGDWMKSHFPGGGSRS